MSKKVLSESQIKRYLEDTTFDVYSVFLHFSIEAERIEDIGSAANEFESYLEDLQYKSGNIVRFAPVKESNIILKEDNEVNEFETTVYVAVPAVTNPVLLDKFLSMSSARRAKVFHEEPNEENLLVPEEVLVSKYNIK